MAESVSPATCPQCGTQLAPALLSCPVCHRLVHADRLKTLAEEADRFSQERKLAAALTTWRHALELLPRESRQHQVISAKVLELSRQVDAGSVPPSPASGSASAKAHKGHPWLKRVGVVGVIGALLWKFKFLVVFLLTKFKLLLLGLTKASTFFSMILSLGVYWTAWGWKFAFGLVLSIYVHEMGHVAALRRYGIKASAPMFIPGLGALVRLKQYPADAREDARVGLAGPLWGLAAAVVAYGVCLVTGWGSWGAIARVGAWINLFNLLPVWQLDGGRGFRALSRAHRWWIVAALGAMLLLTSEGLLALLLLVGGVRAFSKEAPVESDRPAFWQFLLLVVALSLLCKVPVPVGATP